MPAQPKEVSVSLPFTQAIDWTKVVLFRPFDAGKWFVMGFCAWLALLGQGGSGGGVGHYNFGGKGGWGEVQRGLEKAWDFVVQNLEWIVPLAATLVVIGLAVWLVLLWLSSRGQFMFLHCVALNRAEVSLPWHKYAREGNSLFLFRLALGVIGWVLTLPLVAGVVLLIVGMVRAGAASVGGVLGVLGLGLLLLVVGVVLAIVVKLTKDFVVPIQFLRGNTCPAAWRELTGLISANVANTILYLLFQIVLSIALGLLVVVLVLATCCVAGCLFAIPYLGTVFLLPILVFARAYSIWYLAQYGPEYDVFAAGKPA